MVIDPAPEKRERVDVVATAHFQHIQVQMGTEGVTGVAAQGDYLTSLYRIFVGFGNNLYFPTLLFVLQCFYPFGNRSNEGTQMPVNGVIAVVVGDVEYIA